MKTSKLNKLSSSLQDFFFDHLPRLRGMSPHTIHSYRDCLTLLIRFVAVQRKRPVTKLNIEDFDTKQIIDFLQMLENERHNSPTTRNIRLAAIHVYFRYLAGRYPEILEHCQQILAIPFKRTRSRVIEYFEYDEIQSVLATIDRSKEDGIRDYILLATMFNTGARVQEILDLRLCDLQLIKPYHARLFGKGRKERLCPLWPQTAQLLQEFILTRHNIIKQDERVFLNHRKQPLTRFGIRYLLTKYCNLAKRNTPTLKRKRLHPHSMRHSTAVHLLKAGVGVFIASELMWSVNKKSTVFTRKYLNDSTLMKCQH